MEIFDRSFLNLLELVRNDNERGFLNEMVNMIRTVLLRDGQVHIPMIGTISLSKKKKVNKDKYYYIGIFHIDPSFKEILSKSKSEDLMKDIKKKVDRFDQTRGTDKENNNN